MNLNFSKKLLTSVAFVSFQTAVLSQNVGINSSGLAPDASSMLDVSSTSKGFLIPRMTTAQKNAIASPATGLLVFDTNLSAFYFYNGTAWIPLLDSVTGWELDGNTGTTAGTDYLGTTDAQDLVFKTNGIERARIDALGNYFGIGTTTPSNALDVAGISATTSTLKLARYSNNVFSGYIDFYKSRGTSIGSNVAIQSLDRISTIGAYANDGTSTWIQAADIYTYAGAAPSGGNVSTGYYIGLNDGNTGLTKRLQIYSDGSVGFNNTTSITGYEYSLYPTGTSGKTDVAVISFGSDATSGSSLVVGYGRGTQSSHTPVLSGDLLGSLQFSGYNSSSTIKGSSFFNAYASENFSSTASGSDLRFYTTPVTTNTAFEAMRITNSGGIEIGGVMSGILNADVHIVGSNNATMLLAPNQTTSGRNSTFYLSEDHDNTYGMSLLYDGTTNQMQIEGYVGATNYTNLITIDRNTGNTVFAGTIAKGGGSFRIDHPLDPENKILYHSFVESPDMMNIYNGNTITNENGESLIELPDYFEALNFEFRYQLTVIGEFSQAIIAKEIEKNQFTIKTDKPNVKVSWQVTGIRQDPFANENRIPTTVDKEEWEKGYYIHPKPYGKSLDYAIGNAPVPTYNEENNQETIKTPLRRKVHQKNSLKENKNEEIINTERK